MTQETQPRRKAEAQITEELANQAAQEPGSSEENESKERRAQAEKQLRDSN